MSFSVLMSVYIKESPHHLRESLESILSQTLLPNEIILVEDGLLTHELYEVINDFHQRCDFLKVLKLEKNQGLGNALNAGTKLCQYEYIARMDSDDICFPERFAKQMAFLEKHKDVDVVGCWTREFTEEKEGEKKYHALKKFPVTVWDNIKFAVSRCPVEHPAVIMKKDLLIKAGGYKDMYLFEDYYLWARMFVNGCKFSNIPEPLLYFRMTNDSFKRRGGWRYAKSEANALKVFKNIGFLSQTEYIRNLMIRFPVRIMPNFIRSIVYKTLLRKYK